MVPRVPVARLPDRGSAVPTSRFASRRRSTRTSSANTNETEVLDGAMDVLVNVTYFRDSRLRFFGFGNETPQSGENRTTRKTSLRPSCASHIAPSKTSRSPGRERLENATIHQGGVTDLPFTGTLYPNTPGLDGATINAQGFTIAYDDRDSKTITNHGSLGAAQSRSSPSSW